MPDRTVSVAGEFELSVRRSEETQTVRLHNLYGEYRRAPALFGEIVRLCHAGRFERFGGSWPGGLRGPRVG